jgi:pyridoxamine-phosphate oxidase
MSIASIRKDYQMRSLSEHEVSTDPFIQFTQWWDEAVQSEILEVNAMTLSTIKSDGRPSARIVLLKGFDQQGFVFYTNYESDKGKQLQQNPYASLVFFWKELERQVRIEGCCTRTSDQESSNYFRSRPLGSRLGAWASPQSRVIRIDSAVSGRRYTATAPLGRISVSAGSDRVLAGQEQSFARQDSVREIRSILANQSPSPLRFLRSSFLCFCGS